MSSHGGGSKVGDFALLILFLVILFFLWYMLGGKKHEAIKEGQYIKPLTETESKSPLKTSPSSSYNGDYHFNDEDL